MSPLASPRGGRLRPELKLPQRPPPELLTIHDAAAYFHVNEALLEKLLTTDDIADAIPVRGQDAWGQDLYLRTDIEEAIKAL
jgi:hypothetical protein